jgi:hypothetical protein
MRRLSLCAAMIFALPPVSVADEPGWVAIGPGDSFTQYVDINSLRIRAGRLTASTLTDFAAPQQIIAAEMKPYLSVTMLSTYDCTAHRAGVLHITFHADAVGRGEVLKTITIQPAHVAMSHSSPGSLGQREIEKVCSMWAQVSKGIATAAKQQSSTSL